MSAPIFTLLFLPMLLIGSAAFAHGGADTSAETRHPETQIGLPGSRMGHDDMGTTTGGLTRAEVAALIHDTQATEEKHSVAKITLLSLSIIGLVYLYFPRRSADVSAPSADETTPPAATVQPKEGETHAP